MADETRPDRVVLRRLQDRLVEKAENMAIDLQLDPKSGERLANSQASKAMEVAEAAETPRVFLNWVHYQAGRGKEPGFFWGHAMSDDSTLVRRLAAELSWIEQEVAKEVAEVPRRQATVRRASALLLGYFKRALVGLAELTEHRRNSKATSAAAGGKK
jgi:hypothetical protein